MNRYVNRYLLFLLTWSQEVSQATQKAPHTSTMFHFIQQFVKRAEELENRLSEADESIRDQFLERK